MRFLIFILLFSIAPCILLGQKKIISHVSYVSWPTIENEELSNDGKYLFYTVSVPNHPENLIVRSADSEWKMELDSVSSASFTDNSRFLVYKTPNSSLAILELGTKNVSYVDNVSSFKISAAN